VAVFGEKSPLTGQFVAARVNLIEPEPLNDFKKRLRIFCRDKLASYKIPARIELTDRDQFGVRMKKMRAATAAGAPAQDSHESRSGHEDPDTKP
jgi:acyl-coenzyme A synthetase/AMP-(fatty) acid ligase